MASGFELARAWVTIGANASTFNKALASVKKSVAGLNPQFQAMRNTAKWALGGLAGLAGFVVKQQADQEQATSNLRAALAATGQEVENNTKRLSDFSSEMQNITTYTDDSIANLMAFATNLGVTADQMTGVVKAGIGLGKAFFGGDEKAGIEAMAKAQQGNFRELQRMSKEVRDASTPQEKLNAAVRAGMRGFDQAKAETKTFSGSLKQLMNQTGEVGESFGTLLIPSLTKAAQWLKGVAVTIQTLSPAMQQNILRWAGMAAGISAVLVFGPKLASFAQLLIGAFAGITKVVFATGQLLLTAVLTPVGAIIIGLGALATGFAYFAGSGKTASEAIANGFRQVYEMIRLVFDNTSTLGEAWSATMNEFALYIEKAWINASAAIADAFINIKFLDVWDGIVSAADRAAARLVHIWGTAVAAVTDAFSLYQARERMVAAAGLVKEHKDDPKEEFEKYAKAFEAANQEYEDVKSGKHSAANDADARYRKAMEQNAAVREGLQEQKAKDQAAAKAQNDSSQADALRRNEETKRAFEAELKRKRSSSGQASLTKQIDDLLRSIKSGMGFDDLAVKFKELQAKIDAANKGGAAGGPGAPTTLNVAPGPAQTTSLQSAFSENLANMAGGALEGMSQLRSSLRIENLHKRSLDYLRKIGESNEVIKQEMQRRRDAVATLG